MDDVAFHIVTVDTSTNYKQSGVMNSIHKKGYSMAHLLVAQVQKFVELDATVGERTECPLLLELSGEGWVGNLSVSLRTTIAPHPFSIPPSNSVREESTYHRAFLFGTPRALRGRGGRWVGECTKGRVWAIGV